MKKLIPLGFILSILFLIQNASAVVNVTNCTSFTSPDVYVLQNDINTSNSTCFRFKSDNVEFDCQNHIIYSFGGYTFEMDCDDCGGVLDNATLRNCNIFANHTEQVTLLITGANGVNLINNNFTFLENSSGTMRPISIGNTDNVLIQDFYFQDYANNQEGGDAVFYISNCDGIHITGLNIDSHINHYSPSNIINDMVEFKIYNSNNTLIETSSSGTRKGMASPYVITMELENLYNITIDQFNAFCHEGNYGNLYCDVPLYFNTITDSYFNDMNVYGRLALNEISNSQFTNQNIINGEIRFTGTNQNIEISNVLCNKSSVAPSGLDECLVISNANNITIKDVYADHSEYNATINDRVLYFGNVNNSYVENVTSIGNNTGRIVVWSDSQNNYLKDILLTYPNRAVAVYGVNNTFDNITVEKSERYGFFISASNTTVKNSRVENCNEYVFHLSSMQTSPDNNLFYNNYFNNTNITRYEYDGTALEGTGNEYNTVKTSGTNIVGGTYLGGNYWSRPDGTGFSQTCYDENNDTICDSAYSFNPTDNYPLADQTRWGSLIPSEPITGKITEVMPSPWGSLIALAFGFAFIIGIVFSKLYSAEKISWETFIATMVASVIIIFVIISVI